MLKELARILGISFILSGIILFFYPSSIEESDLQVENKDLHQQMTALKTQLDETKKELAHLQTATSEAQGVNENGQNTEAETDQENAENENTQDTSTAEESDTADTSTSTLTLRVESGTTSKDVATQLENANIIEDAQAFNDQLKAKNLTTSIQIGEYDIDASMSAEAIAKLITTSSKDH